MKSFFQGLYELIAIALMAFSMYLFAKVVSTNDLTHLLTPANYTLTIPVIVLLLAIIFLCLSTIEERDEHINELKQISTDMYNKLHETNRNLQQAASTINENLKSNYGNILNVFIVAALLTAFTGCQKELSGSTSSVTADSITANDGDTVFFAGGHRRDTFSFASSEALLLFFRDKYHIYPSYTGKMVFAIHHSIGVHPTHLTVRVDDEACSAFGEGCYGDTTLTDTSKRVIISPFKRAFVDGGASWPWNSLEGILEATGPKGGWIRVDLVHLDVYADATGGVPLPSKDRIITGYTLVFP